MTLNTPEVNRRPNTVLIELKAPKNAPFAMAVDSSTDVLTRLGIETDNAFAPIRIKPTNAQRLFMNLKNEDNQHLLIRAKSLTEDQRVVALNNPDVVSIWSDAIVEPFACAIPPCDCSPSTPRGNLDNVADFLGVTALRAKGIQGKNMVIGIVDGGITAKGRVLAAGEKPAALINNVIGGWPSDWGTAAGGWGYHGNMCATDALGMAPESRIYDLRIANGDASGILSNAISAYRWAINQYKVNGTPHVLSNSWGMYEPAWAPDYVNDPNHPFSRIVVEAIETGIIVLFAAGNCGDTCPDGRCGISVGPGKSIWGANGHPKVITVGAVNVDGEFVGYSSQGPASLDPHKPDFCSVTHFTGYFNSDSGTSAATPVAAGVAALLKEAVPTLTQARLKTALRSTATDIGPAGWDQHSGAGIISAIRAYDSLIPPVASVTSEADVALVAPF